VPAPPSLSNAALLRDHAIEQNETHHAIQVDEEHPESQSCEDQEGNQCSESDRVEMGRVGDAKVRQSWLPKAMGAAVPEAAVKIRHTAPARAHLSSQEADQRELGPLRSPERFQELLCGVLECGIDCVNGGKRQASTSRRKRSLNASKVQRTGREVN
jgi:hypothetical protein